MVKVNSFCDTFSRVFFTKTPFIATISSGNYERTEGTMPGAVGPKFSSEGAASVGKSLSSRPFLIGVCGGTASGKSTVCDEINKRVAVDHPSLVATVCQDSFYRDLNDEEKTLAFAGDFNFDHPDAVDGQLMLEILQNLKAGQPVQIPRYDYRTHSRVYEESKTVDPADVVLVEGILIFYYKDVRDLFDMKLFVDTDPDTRLARRVQRDINERGRSLQNILHQYLTLVKPAYEEFCLPTKKYADVIIPRGAENKVAIDLIVQHIHEILRGSASRTTSSATTSVSRTRNVSTDTTAIPTNRPH